MRRGGVKLWGGLAAKLIIFLGPTSTAKAQDAGETMTLPELNVSAQVDRAFFGAKGR
jgi:hypothetical protein